MDKNNLELEEEKGSKAENLVVASRSRLDLRGKSSRQLIVTRNQADSEAACEEAALWSIAK